MKMMISTVTYVAICLAFAAAIPYLNDKPSGLEKPAASEKPLYNVEIDDEIYLQPEGTDFSEGGEMIYDDNNVWIIIRNGGAVDIHDFSTGLHYVRANESLPCYVYPTYHSLQDGDDLLNALKAGLRYFHDVDVALVVPITENLIPDPRFAPVEAAKYCDRYQWARIDHYIIAHQPPAEVESGDSHTLVKRNSPISARSVCPKPR